MKTKCEICLSTFYRSPAQIEVYKKRGTFPKYCSKRCQKQGRNKIVTCLTCGNVFTKQNSLVHHDGKDFCNRSCSSIYKNQHKSKGTKISKLEIWIQQKLNVLFPNLEIHYNRNDAINAELDIYFPSLRFAVELNGIFHYEPIFGTEKLNKTQNNDQRKFQACLENNIELCIIDTTRQCRFKESTSQQFLDIILNILRNKIQF